MKIKKLNDKIEENDFLTFDDLDISSDDEKLKKVSFEFLLNLMNYKNQLRMNHWQTFTYSEHKMTDELIEEIDEKVDEIGETLMGTFGRPNINPFNSKISNIDLFATKSVIDKIDEELCKLIESYKDTSYEGIISLLGDFSADIKKFKYLATFLK